MPTNIDVLANSLTYCNNHEVLRQSCEPFALYSIEACQYGYLSCDGKCLNPIYQCDGVIHCRESYIDEITNCPGTCICFKLP